MMLVLLAFMLFWNSECYPQKDRKISPNRLCEAMEHGDLYTKVNKLCTKNGLLMNFEKNSGQEEVYKKISGGQKIGQQELHTVCVSLDELKVSEKYDNILADDLLRVCDDDASELIEQIVAFTIAFPSLMGRENIPRFPMSHRFYVEYVNDFFQRNPEEALRILRKMLTVETVPLSVFNQFS